MSKAETSFARSSRQGQWFATTHWSVVMTAADTVSPHSDSAMEELCRGYWYPLYAFVRRSGHDPDTARELTQEFFNQLLSKRLLHAVDPTKGRFRSWLLGVMKHFLAHEWKRSYAQKRGGGWKLFSLDEFDAENQYILEIADGGSPEVIYDRGWAVAVIEQAAVKLCDEYAAAGKLTLYHALKSFISVEGLSSGYQTAAEALGMSPAATKSAIHRLRQRFQECIREQVAQTVVTKKEIDEEIRYLLTVISR